MTTESTKSACEVANQAKARNLKSFVYAEYNALTFAKLLGIQKD